MGLAKYSPTVSFSYSRDQKWWDKNCDVDSEEYGDIEGYDSYGFNKEGKDRAGHTENDYLDSYIKCEHGQEDLYDEVVAEWAIVMLGKKE